MYEKVEIEDALQVELGEIKDKSWDYADDEEDNLL